MKVVLIECVY